MPFMSFTDVPGIPLLPGTYAFAGCGHLDETASGSPFLFLAKNLLRGVEAVRALEDNILETEH